MPSPDFSSLVEDDGYLTDLGNGVWLMDDHRWALKVWEVERKSQSYSLIHADYHWDSCYDFYGSKGMEEELMHSSPAQVAELVAKGEWIRYDSFIAPAIRRGLVHTVHFYCLQDSIGDNALDSDFLARCGAKQILHSDVSSLAASVIEGASIFDLCLDLFNRSDQWVEGELWPNAEIEQFLVAVRPLIQAAELVTISMSFNYSGTVADTRRLTEFVVPWVLSCRD